MLLTSLAGSHLYTRNDDFTVPRAASGFASASVEAVARDKFTRSQGCEIVVQEFALGVWALVPTQQNALLGLIDLRRDRCVRVGAPTNVPNVRNYVADRPIAKYIHAGHADVNRIGYASCLTGRISYPGFCGTKGCLVLTVSG